MYNPNETIETLADALYVGGQNMMEKTDVLH